jgi:hypothetical protein
MFRAARVAVLLILGFLFLNLVCGYALDYPCISSYVGVLAVGHPLLCGIYGRATARPIMGIMGVS